MRTIHFRLALVAILSFLGLAPRAHAESAEGTRWIVTTARGTGAAGEHYWSTVSLLNPNAVSVEVEVTFLPQSALDGSGHALGDNSAAPASVVAVPAGQTQELSWWWWPGESSIAGAIRVVPITKDSQGRPLPVAAFSRTSGTKVDPEREFRGPFIAAQGPETLVGVGAAARIPLLETGPSRNSSYRSNLFLLSTNPETDSEVEVTLVDGGGESRGTKVLTLGRLSQTQLNDLGRAFGYELCLHGCPSGDLMPETFDILLRVRTGGPIVAGGVVIEATNGSGIYVVPVKVAAP